MKTRILSIVEQYVLPFVFVTCVFLSIRWCDFPAIKHPVIESMFVPKKSADSVAVSLVSGYITGYIVYFLTVLLPKMKRDEPIEKLVMQELTVVYEKSIYLLLLMCKNTCTEAEWKKVLKNTDMECFDELFFIQMEKFDISSNADTIFLHANDKTQFKWCEYLENIYEDMYNKLNELFLRYHSYLKQEETEIILSLKDSKYFDAFLGKGRKLLTLVHASDDGFGYYENFSLSRFYIQEGNHSPIFSANNENVNNSITLREYVEELKQVYEFLNNYKRKHELEILNEDYAVSKLREEKIGRLNVSVWKEQA